MQRDSSGMRAAAATTVLAAAMAGQAAAGLLRSDAYRDAAWIRAAWYANDWVTLALAAPALAVASALARRGSARARLVRLGLLGYAVYNYAFYALGAALNAFFPIYPVLVVLAAGTLGVALRETEASGIAAVARARPRVRIVGAYLLTVSALLGGAWLGIWGAYAFAGRPTPVEPDAFRLVAALDLMLMVPALAGGGVLLWRRRPWGHAIGALAAVQGTLYLLVLATGSLVAVGRGLEPAPGEAPLWGTLALLTGTAAATLLADVGAPRGTPR
jgi:hypothetical protein